MDVREKLVKLVEYMDGVCPSGVSCYNCPHEDIGEGCSIQAKVDYLIKGGVTVQEWISVKKRTPTEADGTVWVCLADVFPYNQKEPYINAKHDRRITEAHYSEFTKCWYKDGAVFSDGIITHWMEKAQPPKGD